MSRHQTEQQTRLFSPEYPFTPLSQTLTATARPQQPSTTMSHQQGITITSSQSSSSIGSRTTEEKAEDELFDKIEDLLGNLMRNPSPHHSPCRVFQWPLSGDPSRVLTAVITISPGMPRN